VSRIVLIGYGAIGRTVVEHLVADGEGGATVAAVLVRAPRVEAARQVLPQSIAVVTTIAEALALKPDLVVECAGQGAVADYGEAVLAAGIDLMVIAIGALADAAMRARLAAAARRTGAQILLPAGAIAGIDGLGALKIGGLSRVRYTSTKPPNAWLGTPAEAAFDLAALSEPTVVFTGPADEAARLYPKNANVAATVALAGAGFEATEVRLVADPTREHNSGRIEAEGRFGRMDIEMRGQPAPDNPKTSAVTALSMLRAIRNRDSTIVI
jgi:aspartate dehydrogenase